MEFPDSKLREIFRRKLEHSGQVMFTEEQWRMLESLRITPDIVVSGRRLSGRRDFAMSPQAQGPKNKSIHLLGAQHRRDMNLLEQIQTKLQDDQKDGAALL